MKKLLCMSAILALTSTATISFANEGNTNDNLFNNETKQVIPKQQAGYATGTVNIRSNAGTSYKVIHQLKKGEAFMLTNDPPKKANGYTWVKGYCRNHSGTTGWVATQYLTFD